MLQKQPLPREVAYGREMDILERRNRLRDATRAIIHPPTIWHMGGISIESFNRNYARKAPIALSQNKQQPHAQTLITNQPLHNPLDRKIT